jgi:hypothetical protein
LQKKSSFQGMTYDCAMAGAVSAVTDSLTNVHGRGEWMLRKRTVDRAVSVFGDKIGSVAQRREKLGENLAEARHRKGVSIKPSSTRRTRPDRLMLNFIKNGERRCKCARLVVGWVWRVGG